VNALSALNTPAAAERSVYTDFSGLNRLKALATEHNPAAIEQTARQFEALFTQMLLKSMRQADFGGGILDSQETKMYRGLFDQQLALTLSHQGSGLGIASMIERQLRAQSGVAATQVKAAPTIAAAALGRPFATSSDTPGLASKGNAAAGFGTALHILDKVAHVAMASALPGNPIAFVRALVPYAEQAAARLGVSARALLAQAALETGWGAHIPSRADGQPSFNLFGIKTGAGWRGESVKVSTLEFVDGIPVRRQDQFRAYPSPAASFHDYAQLLLSSPGYRQTLNRGENIRGFAEALASSGYATDPHYADKLVKVAESPQMNAALASLKLTPQVPLHKQGSL